MKELHGTVTDVYGARRVHRLSLMVNRHGDIRTIYCVPCGPLAYLQQQTPDSESSGSGDLNTGAKEDEYSKVNLLHITCIINVSSKPQIIFLRLLPSNSILIYQKVQLCIFPEML